MAAQIVPQVKFADLDKLTDADLANIKRKGCVVIRDVVDDAEAAGWKTSLAEFAKANPEAPGMRVINTVITLVTRLHIGVPPEDPQFFML
jgi:hypothetical protein